MRNLEKELEKRTINYSKLIEYGFKKKNNRYVYEKRILNNSFEVNIVISEKEQYSKLIDLDNETEYALVDVEDATGEFVGNVRQEYENVLKEIFEKCTSKEIFKSKQAKQVIEYIRQKYDDELEFLWEKFDDIAIWRNKQNNKWYALIGIIPKNKIGIDSEEKIEMINLRFPKEKIEEIIDNNNIFPGYHMNKKSWITIKLDESVSANEIFKLIDNSYNLSVGNKKYSKRKT